MKKVRKKSKKAIGRKNIINGVVLKSLPFSNVAADFPSTPTNPFLFEPALSDGPELLEPKPFSLSRFVLIKELDFDAGHRLVNYDGKCGHNHGHYYKVELILAGSNLNKLGILVDFSEMKKKLGEWVDANWDHGMLLNSEDTANIKFHQKQNYKFFVFENENPTAENIAKFLYNIAKKMFGEVVFAVRVHESPKSSAIYTQQQVVSGFLAI